MRCYDIIWGRFIIVFLVLLEMWLTSWLISWLFRPDRKLIDNYFENWLIISFFFYSKKCENKSSVFTLLDNVDLFFQFTLFYNIIKYKVLMILWGLLKYWYLMGPFAFQFTTRSYFVQLWPCFFSVWFLWDKSFWMICILEMGPMRSNFSILK